jgi:hypothetical protein
VGVSRHLLPKKGTDLLLGLLAVTSQGLHDPVGVGEVDLADVLLVFGFFAEFL